LFQSHFGPDMDARHLPGSWSSTPNALEAQAYRCKNCAFVIDDFIPMGTQTQRQGMQKAADQLLRGQGNQAGRARLTDSSNLQTTMYPRGLIMSTGEDIPEGHSVRGRTLILELSPGDVSPQALSKAQANRSKYAAAMYGFCHWLANNPEIFQVFRRNAQEQRDQLLGVGHTRTPGTIGKLLASVNVFLEFAMEMQVINNLTFRKLHEQATAAIIEAGNEQEGYLVAADPVDTFTEALLQLLQGHQAHLRRVEGGIPRRAVEVGWTKQEADGDDIATYKANGKCLGWIDWDHAVIYLDAAAGYAEVRKAAKDITLTKQTMWKRMKEAGLLAKTDEARSRNVIRQTCEGQRRTVLALKLTQVLDTQEV
jgi:hypothetical protein